MIKEELHARAEEAASCEGKDAFKEGDGEGQALGRETSLPSWGAARDSVIARPGSEGGDSRGRGEGWMRVEPGPGESG